MDFIKIDSELLMKIKIDICEVIKNILEDESQRIIVIGLSIIVVSLFMIYRNSRARNVQQQSETSELIL